jgi:hypothetical protein
MLNSKTVLCDYKLAAHHNGLKTFPRHMNLTIRRSALFLVKYCARRFFSVFRAAVNLVLRWIRIKALLHDAIFLATCNAILLLRDVKLASTILH